MKKSIITEDDNCFIHKTFFGIEIKGAHVHHCIHGSNRKLADEDGLTVNLCPLCHMMVHDKGYYDKELERVAQIAWMEHYHLNENDFIERYGKSYIG